MTKTLSIAFDSTIAQIMQKALIILTVIASIVFCIGFKTAKTAEEERKAQSLSMEAVENMKVTVTGKTNRYAITDSLKFDFSVAIKNDNDIAVNYIEGILIIKDSTGRVLTKGTATFGTTATTTALRYSFPANTTQTYTLSWEDNRTDNTIEIWNSDSSSLKYSFEITKIRVENYAVVDVSSKP